MTVQATTNREDAIGNDATDTYSAPFRIFADTDVLVSVEDLDGDIVTLALTTDYTVAGVGLYAGFSITLVNAGQAWLTAGGDLKQDYKIAIRRRLPLTQLTDLQNAGGFFPETHETVFDRLLMIDQQQQDELDRSLKFPETDGTGLTVELPAAAVRASRYLGFDAFGNVIATGGGPGAVPVSSFMETVLGALDATAARATLDAAALAGSTAQAFSVSNLVFPSTQVPSADPNTLDDYQEGPWTPTLGGTATYTLQLGRYQKIGKRVFVEGYLSVGILGTGSTYVISGLPFPCANDTIVRAVSIGIFLNLAIAVGALSAYIPVGSSNIELIYVPAAGAVSVTTSASLLQNGTSVSFSAQYDTTD
jgi:hypothetical protein